VTDLFQENNAIGNSDFNYEACSLIFKKNMISWVIFLAIS